MATVAASVAADECRPCTKEEMSRAFCTSDLGECRQARRRRRAADEKRSANRFPQKRALFLVQTS
ncbi:Protein of unknown function [Gryllus bimaculatus]|nr:Protein of unknown function [Gryllus bimaculatus]